MGYGISYPLSLQDVLMVVNNGEGVLDRLSFALE